MEIKVSKSWRKKLGLADGETFEVKSGVDAFDEKAGIDFAQPLPREHKATLSTAAIDLDDEVLMPKGCDFAVFEKNPLAFFGHAWRGYPIGNWKDWSATSSKVTASLDIVERPMDRPKEAAWEPDDVNYLIHRRVLRGVSVGFKRLEAGRPEPKEIEKTPEWSRAKAITRRWMLLEASVVPMPCNHEAWLKEVSQGSVSKSIMEALDAPESISLSEDHWKAAHAFLLGELATEELDKLDASDEIKYILSILGLHGFTRELVLAPKQVVEAQARITELEAMLLAAKDIKPQIIEVLPDPFKAMTSQMDIAAKSATIILDKVFDMIDNTLAQVTGRVTR